MTNQHLGTVVLPTVEEARTFSTYTWNYGTLIVEATLTKVDTSTAEDSAQVANITSLTVRSANSSKIYVHCSKFNDRVLLSDQNFKYLISGVKELVYKALDDVRGYARVKADQLTEAITLLNSGK